MAITRAVFREIARTGYGALTMESVARRAGVGKAALYRRWPGKLPMVADLLSRVGVPLAEIPDTGSLQGDVHAFLVQASRLLRHRLVRRVLRDLYAEMERSPPLATAMREGFQEDRRERVKQILRRAIHRGELRSALDQELALDLLVAPLYWRLVMTRNPTGPDYLEALTTMTVSALKVL